MKTVEAGQLDVAYEETGPADGAVAILLHGFPYDVRAYDEVCPQLAEQGFRCLLPYLRGYGQTRFLSADVVRSGQQAALGHDLRAFMDALGIERAVLGGYDWGGRAACIVAALWSERVTGLVSCGAGYNIQDIVGARQPADAQTEHRFWYQYYFHTERGHLGLEQNRRDIAHLLWKLWSPSWHFDATTFEATAASFDNPDFVDVVIHSYRHRFGLIPGDPAFDPLEEALAARPPITVPSVVLQGADDGVGPPPAIDEDAPHFTGPYRRQIVPGVGHNFPQEAPEVFAQAVLDVSDLS